MFFFGPGLLAQVPSFTVPDTVCINSPVTITNTSTGGSNFYWNFCVGDLSKTPEVVDMGNIGGVLAYPVFMDIVSDNGHYYGFLTNNFPSGLVRLDFGSSMLNIPTVTNFGTLGGVIPAGGGLEGIQVVKNDGKWYAIMVGFYQPLTGNEPRILKVDFGADLSNPSPVATDWGNLGNLSYPTDLYIFNENGSWYGFTANFENNTITQFNFGSGFDNPPAATNLGNFGNLLNEPVGLCPVKDGTEWHLFVVNEASSLIRLDFGSSLLNAPAIVNVGNTGDIMHQPRDLRILRFCDETVGFYVDADANYYDIGRLDFHNDLLSTPTATSLGNFGIFNFPHSLTKIFRDGADLYCFVPSVTSDKLARLKFPGCNNSTIPNSSLKDPPVISYSQTGTYNINMMMDEGLESEASFCKTVTVIGPPDFDLGRDTALCGGDSLILKYQGSQPAVYNWQDGSSADSFAVYGTGKYKLTAANTHGCAAADSVEVQVIPLPAVKTLADTAVCAGGAVSLLTTVLQTDSVRWSPATGLSDPVSISPVFKANGDIQYIVTAFDKFCTSRDTVQISVLDTPHVMISADTLICTGGTAQLLVMGAAAYQYRWLPSGGLSDGTIANPQAYPASTTIYRMTATAGNGCTSRDSVLVQVKPPDVFSLYPASVDLCRGDSVILYVRSKGVAASSDSYTWIPDISLPDPHAAEITVSPQAATLYQVLANDNICATQSALSVLVNVVERPVLSLSKSNDINCIYGEATLTVSGGVRYAWSPVGTLTDPYASLTMARTDTTTVYYVLGKGVNGCTTLDSITVLAGKGGGSLGFPMANAFTPNGDGNNDCFGIKYWGYVGSFEMAVYNRWGERVYYSKDPYQCWDGTFSGHPQPAGAYVYVIRAFALCGEAVRRGTVMLIR